MDDIDLPTWRATRAARMTTRQLRLSRDNVGIATDRLSRWPVDHEWRMWLACCNAEIARRIRQWP